jgi:hypothetical protein
MHALVHSDGLRVAYVFSIGCRHLIYRIRRLLKTINILRNRLQSSVRNSLSWSNCKLTPPIHLFMTEAVLDVKRQIQRLGWNGY